MNKIGIFGGTFDPIHFGHLMIAEYLRVEAKLDKVIFIPTGKAPHKRKVTDPLKRYEMTKLAILDNENFKISDIETKREEKSYTIDTIEELEREICGKFFFLIGLDTLFELKTWKKIDKLMEKVKFIVALRPSYMDKKNILREMDFLNDKYSAKIEIVNTPLYEISSTELKKRLLEKKSVKYLMPNSVIEYIRRENLYGQ